MKKFFKPYVKMFLFATLMLTLETGADLVQPLLLSKIVDEGVMNKNMSIVFRYGYWMLLITFLGAFFAGIRNYLSTRVSMSFSADVRQALYDKINKLSLADMEKTGKASLITRLTNDASQLQNFVNGIMRIYVKAPLIFAGSLWMSFLLSPSLALVVLLCLPLMAILIFMNIKLSYPIFMKLQESIDALNKKTREFLNAIPLIKSFDSYSREKEMFQEVNQQLGASTAKTLILGAIFGPLLRLIFNIALVVVIWYGGFLKQSGSVTPGTIMAFISYIAQVQFSMVLIGVIFNASVRAVASGKRIMEVLNLKDALFVKALPPMDIKDLAFHNVSFSYPQSQRLAIENISFQLLEGESLGIIGSIGSGKSTLVNLLAGLYEDYQGDIWVNKELLPPPGMGIYLNSLGIVPQQPILFSGTIAENLHHGKIKATQEEMWSALEDAQAESFVSQLPGQLDALIQRDGMNLSGGQKQRLTLARALIRNPEILILDDSFSKLDIGTELKLRKKLFQNNKGKMIIIVSQKVLTIKNCTKILVLDKGKMAGYGSHQGLIQTSPTYKEIVDSQMGGDFDA